MTDTTNPGWYDQLSHDDAMLGPEFAEARWFPHEQAQARRLRAITPDPTGGQALVAFVDCLLARRAYSVVPARITHNYQQEQVAA